MLTTAITKNALHRTQDLAQGPNRSLIAVTNLAAQVVVPHHRSTLVKTLQYYLQSINMQS